MEIEITKYKATLNFDKYETAKAFGREWSFYSLQGYNLIAKNEKGGATVELFNVSEEDKDWIDEKVASHKDK